MKRDIIIAVLSTFCLTVTLFTVIPINSQSVGDYDHWLDINDDGTIDMKDIAAVARAYGTDGTAVNKTALLLELEQRISDVELVCLLMPGIRARLDNLERISFFDDFNDQILDGWTLRPSNDAFIFTENMWGRCMRGSMSYPAIEFAIVDGINVRDCEIEVTMSLGTDDFRAGIICGFTNDTDYYFFFLSDEYDEVGIHSTSSGMLNSTGQYTYPIYPRPWIYNLKAVIYDNTFSLSLNGTEVITASGAIDTIGQVGLCVQGALVYFDDFRVTELP